MAQKRIQVFNLRGEEFSFKIYVKTIEHLKHAGNTAAVSAIINVSEGDIA